MKKSVSPYDRKATTINYTTTFMAKQAGDRLVELITNGWEPSGNLQQWHSEQLLMLDNFIKSIHEKESIVPICENKCSGCCKYPIWATEVEYLYISEWITRKVTKDTMDQLHKRFDQWHQDMGDLLDCFEPRNSQKSLEYTRKNN